MSTQTKANQFQIQRYFNLCQEKGLKLDKDFASWTSEEMDIKIQEVRSYKPASEKQIEMMKEMQDRLIESGIIETAVITDYKSLSTQTAFSAITELQALLNSNQHMLKPTPHQIGELTKMFYFPSARFEDFGIKVFKEINMGNGQVSKAFYTLPEIYHLIEENMSAEDATRFLTMYSPEFDYWTSHEKATPDQIAFIRTLENRMYDFSTPKRKELSVDMEGTVAEIPVNARQFVSKWLISNQYPGLSEIEINLFSKEQATKYIQQLNGEISYKKDMRASSEWEKQCIANAEWDGFERNERTRQLREEKELNDFFYAFQSHIGMSIEELQNHAGNALIENPDEKSIIKPFVQWAIWGVCREFCSWSSLNELATRSPQARRLVKIARAKYLKKLSA